MRDRKAKHPPPPPQKKRHGRTIKNKKSRQYTGWPTKNGTVDTVDF